MSFSISKAISLALRRYFLCCVVLLQSMVLLQRAHLWSMPAAMNFLLLFMALVSLSCSFGIRRRAQRVSIILTALLALFLALQILNWVYTAGLGGPFTFHSLLLLGLSAISVLSLLFLIVHSFSVLKKLGVSDQSDELS